MASPRNFFRVTPWLQQCCLKVDLHRRLIFTCVRKENIDNVWKVTRERKSWARFNFHVYAWPSTHYLYFIHARKSYERLHGKITRQWKSNLRTLRASFRYPCTHTFLGPFHAFHPQFLVFNWSWAQVHFFKVEISLHSAYGKSWITWERHFLKHRSRASLLALAKSLYK